MARQTLSGATRRCEMRLQAQLMEPVRGTAYTRCLTEATTFGHRAANATKGRALSPGPHPEDGEGGAGCIRNVPSAVMKTQRKLAQGDSSLRSGHSALIKTK